MPSATPIVIVDFPGQSGERERLRFATPDVVVVAERLDDVRPALAEVERHAAAGRWAAGFVAYDAAPAFDPALHAGGRASTPLLWFGIYTEPERDESWCSPGMAASVPHQAGAPSRWVPHVDRAHYDNAIASILTQIRDGNFYQVNHTLRLRSAWNGDEVVQQYDALIAAQPESYGMCVDTERFAVLSASPELFLSRRGNHITTRPMKGTARRGRWLAEDSAIGERLAASIKDRAENVMIVDLVRNDLGRIAKTGSVRVTQLFAVERHPSVWQMTSTITADLREDVPLAAIFSALFPCGSVVGAPKIAAAAWIADHEEAPRGVYCGAMGVVRPGGDCVFNVAIRTVVVDRADQTAVYGVGGGITIDSTAGAEYDELGMKALVLAGPPAPFELLETMHLADGTYVRRSRHLARLCESARYFGFADPAVAANAALDAEALACTVGHYRVRLLVGRDGRAHSHSTPLNLPPAGGVLTLTCALSTTPVQHGDVFLYHKTTHRRVYEARRAERPDVDEVVLWNDAGELTECSIGNLVLSLDGERVTPPRECGLLAGTFRAELLANGGVREQVLTRSDLARASAVWMINSVREWVPMRALP